MPFNGSGGFSRLFSWVADAAAGIDISSSRTDADTNDIATGLTDCITRDGQSLPTGNLPMGNFKHTGVADGAARADYSSLGQTQDGLANWVVAGGTSDALTATYASPITALKDGQICFVRALAANATTTPTFSPNGLPAHVITKNGGLPLAISDINGALYEAVFRYNLANTRWELLNPSTASLAAAVANNFSTGDVKLTLKTAADSGWVIFDDGTIGSATSGASTLASATAQALFVLLYNNINDANAPIFTSGGGATSRAAQGSAAAAWAANCRMSLTKTLGRALGIAGTGSGLTARPLGQTVGIESNTIAQGNLPAVSLTTNITDPQHNHVLNGLGTVSVQNGGGASQGNLLTTSGGVAAPLTTNNSATGVTASTPLGGSGTALLNMQPSSFLNAMCKL